MRLLLQIPSVFHKNSKVHFQHGGQAWTDGHRELFRTNGSNYTCVPGDNPGCLECRDSLAGVLFRVVTAFEPSESLYHVVALRGSYESGGVTLDFRSPDSGDQKLFLAILHTLREDSRVADGGVLFMGGHRLQAPFVLTNAGGSLVINGYRFPPLPRPARPPDPSAEWEARPAIAADLVALRDSIEGSGAEWSRVREAMKARALQSPFVKSVEVDGNRFTVVWHWGYQYLEIPEHAGCYSYGGGDGCYEQDEQFAIRRLDLLQATLNGGNVLFLLGAGAEYVVSAGGAETAIEGVKRILAGRPLTDMQSKLLPADVRAQLLSPVNLVRAQ